MLFWNQEMYYKWDDWSGLLVLNTNYVLKEIEQILFLSSEPCYQYYSLFYMWKYLQVFCIIWTITVAPKIFLSLMCNWNIFATNRPIKLWVSLFILVQARSQEETGKGCSHPVRLKQVQFAQNRKYVSLDAML